MDFVIQHLLVQAVRAPVLCRRSRWLGVGAFSAKASAEFRRRWPLLQFLLCCVVPLELGEAQVQAGIVPNHGQHGSQLVVLEPWRLAVDCVGMRDDPALGDGDGALCERRAAAGFARSSCMERAVGADRAALAGLALLRGASLHPHPCRLSLRALAAPPLH
eukprot:4394371-Pleurochrysis_carterae.AAC.2